MDTLTMVILSSLGFIAILVILCVQLVILKALMQIKQDAEESHHILLTQGETQTSILQGRFQAIIKAIGFLSHKNGNENTSNN